MNLLLELDRFCIIHCGCDYDYYCDCDYGSDVMF